jgi:hypothetical protein
MSSLDDDGALCAFVRTRHAFGNDCAGTHEFSPDTENSKEDGREDELTHDWKDLDGSRVNVALVLRYQSVFMEMDQFKESDIAEIWPRTAADERGGFSYGYMHHKYRLWRTLRNPDITSFIWRCDPSSTRHLFMHAVEAAMQKHFFTWSSKDPFNTALRLMSFFKSVQSSLSSIFWMEIIDARAPVTPEAVIRNELAKIKEINLCDPLLDLIASYTDPNLSCISFVYNFLTRSQQQRLVHHYNTKLLI